VLWLAQRLIIPHDLQGYPLGVILRLALTWWAEAAQIFVNGVAVQEGDLRLLNQGAAQPICELPGRNYSNFAAGKSESRPWGISALAMHI